MVLTWPSVPQWGPVVSRSSCSGILGVMPTAADLASLLAAARQRAVDLGLELRDLKTATAEGPDDEHDPEGATIGFERARVAGIFERACAEVSAFEEATRRVRNGTYGRCAGCGQPVPAERLEALPATDRCVACASRRLRDEAASRQIMSRCSQR